MRRFVIAISVLGACAAEDTREAPEHAEESGECADAGCELPCEGPATPCIDVCGGAEHYDATCEHGEWSCGIGIELDACTACAGVPSPCIEACGSDVDLGEAVCEGTTWVCSEGVAADSCAPCEGEEPLECAASCAEGEIYEAECIDDAWDCGDGVVLESCAAPCGAATPCPEGCGGDGSEPWPCVPSCEVFEIYDATCVDEAWSCGEGVLAADC